MRQATKALQLAWLASLAFIPLLSIYGRPLQRFAKSQLSANQLIVIIGLILFLLTAKVIFWFIKEHQYKKVWHLIWFLPVFLVIPFFMPIIEERVHFIVFGSFGFLSMMIFTPKLALALCVSISVLDEVLQHFLPDRVGDLYDIGINLFASLAGTFFAYISWKQK